MKLDWEGKKFRDPLEKLLQPALGVTLLAVFCVSLEEKIDMAEVLSYLLTPVPLSLSYSDGSILSSPKSNLMKYLETFALSETLEVVHETIIDAMFFLRVHVNLPNTFEAVTRYI